MIQLPEEMRGYLSDESLTALWDTVRTRLERNGLTASGQVAVALDERGADRLAGLLGTPTRPGHTKVQLAALDAALRKSAASAGVVAVTAAVTGRPLIDRRAARAERMESWTQVWDRLDASFAQAGLADAEWVPAFIDAVRRSGVLTRAGVAAATTAVEQAATTLGELAPYGPLTGQGAEPVEARWELGELAGRCIGNAHGLDDGRLTAALVLRAAATALNEPMPTSASGRRDLWARIGVTPDLVSGTVLVWGLCPPGGARWAVMMRERADLRLVTHLTLQELRGAAAGIPLITTHEVVYACENPQVLQAASRADVSGPLLCFAGNPASSGWLLLRELTSAGATVRYHGDFDWPGMAIAGRLFAAGAVPWRMTTADYDDALATLTAESRLTLGGTPIPTPWDERLSARMHQAGVAVHEESILSTLLSDLQCSDPQSRTPHG